MDGTHIRVDKPREDPDSYINRNKYYSIQLQAVVDHKNRFWDVFVGYPGSVHDARVFSESGLKECLERICDSKSIFYISIACSPSLKLRIYGICFSNSQMELLF